MPRATEMSPPGFHPATNGYHEDTSLEARREYIPGGPTDSTRLPSFQGDPASPSERPVPAGGQEIDTGNWAAFDQGQFYAEDVVAGPSAAANNLQYFTPDPSVSSRDSGIPPHYPYGTAPAEVDYCRAEPDFLLSQRVTPPPPMLHSQDNIHHYIGGGRIEHAYPLCGSPVTSHVHTEGYSPSSSTTPNYNHEFHDAILQMSPDLDRAYPPYAGFVWPCPPLNYPTWAGPIVAVEGGPSGTADHSVSGRPDGMGTKEVTALPKGSPPPGTSNIETREPKKRKRPDSRGGVPRKHARHSRSQHHDNPQRMLIQPTPSSQPRPSNLRLARQDDYVCGNTQTWDKLPDIVFKVGGVDGIRLTEALNSYFDGPDGRDQLMFADGNFGSSFSCRIHFKGFPASKEARPISTWNYKAEKVRITRKKLAEYTAKRIVTYLQELAGAGTPYGVPFQDMVLTKLIHVSKASFRPQIRH